MGRQAKTLPVAECKRCGRRAKTQVQGYMICHGCYWREPKNQCRTCGKEKRFVTENGGICLQCSERALFPEEIECRECGKIRPPAIRASEYCEPCRERLKDKGVCSACGKQCSFWLRTKRLCKRCALNYSAPERLRTFVKNLQITYEYNRLLFYKLVATINWEAVHEEVRRRFVDFGEFLQTHEFEEALSWSSIHDLNRELCGAQYRRVRECLQQLAELLFGPEPDKLKHSDVRAFAWTDWMPADLRALMEKYDEWSKNERRNSYDSRSGHFFTLSKFWKCCANRGLKCFSNVTPEHVDEFLYTLSFKWKCRTCSLTRNLLARVEAPPEVCLNLSCGAHASFERVTRCLEQTVFSHRAALRIFFGWLKDVEYGIEVNPAPTPAKPAAVGRRSKKRKRKNPAKIQYYDWDLIDPLFEGIQDPTYPPRERMALCLVLHHGFYVRELQTVRIPFECRPLIVGGASPEPLERVFRLEWQPRELSRNRQFLGRSGSTFEMEPADEPWLPELIKTFMHERSHILRNLDNPYLFVGTHKSNSRAPLCRVYFYNLIQRATARITGRVCNPSILAKSCRLLHSEFGGYAGWRHLRELGLCEGQARVYAWAQRIRVVPKQPSESIVKRISIRSSPLTLPAKDVFGIPTTACMLPPPGVQFCATN